MPPSIGFALLTHASASQVSRLVDRLRRLYGPAVPIAIHHDQGQCALRPGQVPGAKLVEPSLATAWGTWSLVEATLAALRLLHSEGGPDYTVLLSGADYPVAPASRVLADLAAGGADAYLCGRPVDPWRRDTDAVPGPLGLGVNEGAAEQEKCYRRYYPTVLRLGPVRHRIRLPHVAPLLSPFSRRVRAYAGDQWWTLGRAAVRVLLGAPQARPDLVRWFAARPIPDEAYVQTVICNAPDLRVCQRIFRYVDWTPPGPQTLRAGDLPRILASGSHFARKFQADDAVLDLLDRHLGLPPWTAADGMAVAPASGALAAPRRRDRHPSSETRP
jgi:hypothetical protein